MRLYLLRHAEAVGTAERDELRELTEKGREQARRVGKFCERHGIEPEVILTSPYLRAAETARLAAKELPNGEVLESPFLASGMEPETAIEELRPFMNAGSVMIVGHEPDFSRLAARLTRMDETRLHVRKASLTLIEVSSFDPIRASLEFMIPPRLMEK